MAHAKAVNRKKNTEDFDESPHNTNTPIGGGRGQNDDYEDTPMPLPKKKKKIKPPTSLNSSINDDNADESGASGSGSPEIEIVFKLHPEMLADINQKEVVKAMKDNNTRYIKTTSRALVEHLCKYLAMRIALDLAKTSLPSNSSNAGSSTATNSSASSTAGSATADAIVTGNGTSESGNSSKDAGGSVKDLTIYIASVPGQLTPLATSLALTAVNEKYWKVNKPMEMFYSFKRV